jgi:very-short-patch-repair endonuclease
VPEEAQIAFALSMWKAMKPGLGGLWHPKGDDNCKYTPDDLAFTIARRYAEVLSFFNGDRTESHIERRLFGSLIWMKIDQSGYPLADYLDGPEDYIVPSPEGSHLKFYITSQYKIGNYRADFLVWVGYGDKFRGVVVECDGHDFHEKTKEQAARDKSRDRAILESGYSVMRFTGSEIFKDPDACAKQVQKVMQDIASRLMTEIQFGSGK